MLEKIKILFLCTGNSCRSQMAEGWAAPSQRRPTGVLFGRRRDPWLESARRRVMAQAGVDISGHHSKLLDELSGIRFDHVITVCGNAHESCPVFPGQTRVTHVPFDDPPRLAQGAASEEEALQHYRRVRDEIRAFIETLPASLAEVD